MPTFMLLNQRSVTRPIAQQGRRQFSVMSLAVTLVISCISCEQQELAIETTASPSVQVDAQATEKEPKKASTQSPQPDASQETGVTQDDLPPTKESPVAPRIYAKSRFVWIRAIPDAKAQWIGFLWAGGSVKIRAGTRVPGAGCSGKWTPVEPRGYLCVDEDRATLNGEDPDYLLLKAQAPRVETAFPHHYAAVNAPLKRYQNLPKTEGFEFPALQHWPKGLSENRKKMVARSAFAFSDSFGAEDNAFLLGSDMTWVRKKDVELLPKSSFQGVELNEQIHLPLAFFPTAGRHRYHLNAEAKFVETEVELPHHQSLPLGTERKKVGRHTFYQLRDSSDWVRGKDAVIPEPRTTTPWGAPLTSIWKSKQKQAALREQKKGSRVITTTEAQAQETWMEASILGGWLLAYRGNSPVYATMISAGRGGRPHPGKKAIETASTPTGRFTINGKFKTASMNSSSTPIVHADVPWTQNFSGPHALHSAYWHDDFGKLKSAGCVNISPLDGKWLFEFSEPRVPDDWHGVRAIRRYGKPSTFIVHE